MQKEYLFLGDQEVNNGNYLLALFKIVPADGLSLEEVASEVAAESSTGSNLKVGSATPFSTHLNARVYKIDAASNLVWIAYPWEIFDSEGNVQNILTFIAGNIFGVSQVRGCKLVDVYFPPQMLVQYDGPSYTIDDARKYLGVFDSPILGTIIKPKIGLTSSEYAELCYDFWVGGGHFVKNDEPQANQHFCPYEKMVQAVRYSMDKAEQETGHTKLHSFNVSSADFDTMLRRADYVASVMKPGSYIFLIDGITAGWMAVQTLRRRYPNVFLHFHRAGHGAMTREQNPIGYTVAVLTKFARLAGASGIHTGTAGVGKMAGTPEVDVTAAQLALRVKAQGPHFEQVWSRVAETDPDIAKIIIQEEKIWQQPIHTLVKHRAKHGDIVATDTKDYRLVPKMCPIISGGLNPVLLPEFLEVMGTIDFITTMGGGVHSHPMKTQAGARAVVQSYEAWKQGVPLAEYAKDHEALKVAIEFFNAHGTQAQRLPHGLEEV